MEEADCWPDIVQFDSAVYYADEEEDMMRIDVQRFGRFKEKISVDFHTEDGSGKAGVRYKATSGSLVFQPGEVCKTIEVEILSDVIDWATTLEFLIRLTNPHGCELGRYLYVCRVKVIDADVFPTNRYFDEIRTYGAENLEQNGVSGIDLFAEYVKLNLSYEGILWKSGATLAVDLLQNAYYLLTIYLVKYVADDVLVTNPQNLLVPGSTSQTLLLVGFLYFAPCAVLNGLDIWKATIGLAQDSSTYLQKDIFRKYMNLDDTSKSKVGRSEISLLMVQDVADIVESGYMNLFEFAKTLGKLSVSSYFIWTESPEALVPLVVFSLATAGYFAINLKESVSIREAFGDAQSSILESVSEASRNSRLIADYYMRPQMQSDLEGRIDQLNKRSVPVATQGVMSNYFPIWLSTLLVTGWLAFGGSGVLAGTIQVGAYLATVSVFKEVGDSFKDIFSAVLQFTKAIGPLQKVTILLNMSTVLKPMKAVNRERRRVTKELRTPENLAKLRLKAGGTFGSDAIEIKLSGMGFAYPGKDPILRDVNLTVPQGKLVAIVGSRRRGKATFIKLLGQVLIPTEGTIFVPSYLRILHVCSKPSLFAGSLWRNLCIGRMYWRDEEFESQRVISICRRIGMAQRVLDKLEDERASFLRHEDTCHDLLWALTMSDSEITLIHLARAFIYNPEVLVMNRPTLGLGNQGVERVIELIKEFCNNRGVELPTTDASKRRPRSAFVSFVRMSGVRCADYVWNVDGGQVSAVTVEELDGLSLI